MTHHHVTNREPHKRLIRLTRRQFLGVVGILGAGSGAVCGGLTGVGLLATTQRSTATPTDAPTPLVPTRAPAVTRPPIVDRDTWGALSPDLNARNERGYYAPDSNPEGWFVYPDDLINSYQTLVIHHSGFYESNGQTTLLEIQRAHRQDRGWADVGYHFMVDKDGTIYEGRDVMVRGVHVEGYNTGSLGVCLLGDFRFEAPSSAQLSATIALNAWLVYRTGVTHLAGHQQFNDFTVCPGTFLSDQLDDLATRAGLIFGTDGYRSSVDSGQGCLCCACV